MTLQAAIRWVFIVRPSAAFPSTNHLASPHLTPHHPQWPGLEQPCQTQALFWPGSQVSIRPPPAQLLYSQHDSASIIFRQHSLHFTSKRGQLTSPPHNRRLFFAADARFATMSKSQYELDIEKPVSALSAAIHCFVLGHSILRRCGCQQEATLATAAALSPSCCATATTLQTTACTTMQLSTPPLPRQCVDSSPYCVRLTCTPSTMLNPTLAPAGVARGQQHSALRLL